MGFVEAAEVNVGYVLGVVVHEISGHPEFGGRGYQADIYEEAHKAELGKPWDTPEEENTYGYIGTEIYAAMRQFEYEVPTKAGDRVPRAIDPKSNIDNKVGLIKSKYEPAVGRAVLQGLYERFRVDPRILPGALKLYTDAAEKYFPGVLRK